MTEKSTSLYKNPLYFSGNDIIFEYSPSIKRLIEFDLTLIFIGFLFENQ